MSMVGTFAQSAVILCTIAIVFIVWRIRARTLKVVVK